MFSHNGKSPAVSLSTDIIKFTTDGTYNYTTENGNSGVAQGNLVPLSATSRRFNI